MNGTIEGGPDETRSRSIPLPDIRRIPVAETRKSLERIFKPRSVAVIGASRRKGTLGWQILHNLIVFEFQGKIFPVNPGAEVIHSLKC